MMSHLLRTSLAIVWACLSLHISVQLAFASQDAAEPPAEAVAIFRAPLLREGSWIIEGLATIERDAKDESKRSSGRAMTPWRLVLEQEDSSLPPHTFQLLPCTRLSEMVHIAEHSVDRPVKFKVTGQVLVFHRENYLLPTHATVMAEPATVAPSPQKPDAESSESTRAPAVPSGDSSEDIMRNLEESTGAIARPVAPSTPSASVTEHEPVPTVAEMPGSRFTAEETLLVNRRGKVTRDASGNWIFVFDADASGLADPPMRLMPCLLLERVETYAQRSGNNSAALLSGTVYLYQGQNYLLPTVFRIPVERRNITP